MGNLSYEAPAGSRWAWDEVKTGHGKESLGEAPLLEWESVEGIVGHYGVEGALAAINGTSLWVSYQGIARRMKIAGKSDDEIAKAVLDFRPGKRAVGNPTPVSRAKNAAAAAASVANGDAIAAFLARVARGEVQIGEDGQLVG
jgi:hypothetical protein